MTHSNDDATLNRREVMTMPEHLNSPVDAESECGHTSECPYCGRSFKTVGSLHSHETKMHTSGRWNCDVPLSCPICGKTSKSHQGIKVHMMRCHDNDGIARYANSGKKISESQHRRFMDPKARRRVRESNLRTWAILKADDEFMSGFRNSTSEGTKKALKRPEVIKHIRDAQPKKALHRNTGFGNKSVVKEKTGKSVFCDSSYESRLCEIMNGDNSVLSYGRCIAYFTVPGTGTRYNPDFYVVRDGLPDLILEVKSDYTIRERMVPYKVEAAIDYCRSLGLSYVIMSDTELDMYDLCVNSVTDHKPDIEDLCLIRWDAR